MPNIPNILGSDKMLKRFWAKVEKQDGACWLWHGAVNSHGYGIFRMNKKWVTAHRVSLSLVKKGAPGLCALHSCDVPACVNPSHLRWGSRKENTRDMDSRGRRGDLSGEKSPRAKLTWSDVAAIRSDSRTLKAIAAQYGVSLQCVSRIRRGEAWNKR